MDLTPPTPNEVSRGISEGGYQYIIGVLCAVVVVLFVLLLRELMRARKEEAHTAKELGITLTTFNNNVDRLIESNRDVIETVNKNTDAVRDLEKKL